jgi:hypothetical protein
MAMDCEFGIGIEGKTLSLASLAWLGFLGQPQNPLSFFIAFYF